jgi:hypothetical protein
MTFDATTVEPTSEWKPIPAGDYVVQVVASEMKYTKDGNGQYLELDFQIMEGDQQGRSHIERLNLHNSNQTTVDIAQRTLSSICHAIGKMTVNDSEELHFQPMIASVRVSPRKNEPTKLENKVNYKALEERPAAPRPQAPARPAAPRPQAPARPAPTAPAARSTGNTPPWRKTA